MSGNLVYRVERFTTGLFGTFAKRSRCSVDIEDNQHRTICPTLDSASGIVDGIAAIGAFGNFDRYSALQRTRFVADTPLQSLPRRVATRRLSNGLHGTAPCPLADATKYGGGASVATGNRTRGNTQISKAVTSAFPTGVHDIGSGWRTTVNDRPESSRHGWSKCDRLLTTGLPVSIPLSVLSPRTEENARGTSGFNPSREEGQSMKDMDTNEITIDRIVGFPCNDPGTDELPTPASSPVQSTTPAVLPVEPGDSQELGDNLYLAKVLLDVSVMPTLISPIEDSIGSPTTEVAEYASPEIPTVETVIESPGYAVPEESAIRTSWVPRYSPVSMTSTVSGKARPMSTMQPSPYLPLVMAAH